MQPTDAHDLFAATLNNVEQINHKTSNSLKDLTNLRRNSKEMGTRKESYSNNNNVKTCAFGMIDYTPRGHLLS